MNRTKSKVAAIALYAGGRCSRIDLGDNALKAMYYYLDCRAVEVVQLAPDLHMWLDEEGLLADEPVVNEIATVIAHLHGFNHQRYVGNAIFTGGADEEGNTLGLSEHVGTQVEKWIRTAHEALSNEHHDGCWAEGGCCGE